MSISDKLKINFRQAVDDDINFIFNAWLKSFKGNGVSMSVNNTTYFAEQHKVIEKLLKRCPVIIACNPDDVSQIYGFVCAERIDSILCLHYIYVKHPFRKLGLAYKMLKDVYNHDKNVVGVFTHFTRIMKKLGERWNLLYHPYLLINDEQEESDNA